MSYHFWARRFGRDPSVVGRGISLAGKPFTIVGVLPESFNGLRIDTAPDLRIPAALDRAVQDPKDAMTPGGRPWYGEVFARLRPGADRKAAIAAAEKKLRELYEKAMAGEPRDAFELMPAGRGVSQLREQFAGGLTMLMAGVALLLVMACANVGGLVLARAAARDQEFAVRMAIGAGRGRLMRQLLTESLILAGIGGLCGTVLTVVFLPVVERAMPPLRDRGAILQAPALHIGIDWRVLAFAVAATVLTALVFGLSPAWNGARADLAGVLRAAKSTARRHLARRLMLVAQVAICTVVLIGAALLVETLRRL